MRDCYILNENNFDLVRCIFKSYKENSNKNFKIAGKSGTTRLEYWKSGQPKYQASFVGYYPAENPKYTIYVAINEPNLVKGYNGAIVAFPVFMEIAE